MAKEYTAQELIELKEFPQSGKMFISMANLLDMDAVNEDALYEALRQRCDELNVDITFYIQQDFNPYGRWIGWEVRSRQ